MADDDVDNDSDRGIAQMDTFQQRTQEIRPDHWFPRRDPPGVVSLPPGSRGPRSLYLRRHGDTFGFTLRHFLVYPPDSNSSEGRYGGSGGNLAPMETIFVKHIADNSAAALAGLQCGDRLVAVNQVSLAGKSYGQVIQLIQKSPEYLHLLVVPKEEDVLQKFFARTAYNPETNQRPGGNKHQQSQNESIEFRKRRDPNPRPLTQVYPSHRSSRESREFQADALSWRSLQDPTFSTCVRNCITPQRSADNLIHPLPLSIRPEQRVLKQRSQDVYTEASIHESCQRASRAQPQVPLSRNMGRRASEGSSLCDDNNYTYDLPGSNLSTDMVVSSSKMKSASKFGYPEVDTGTMPGLNSANFRLSLDGERRESSSSLTSSIADGSKDSLSSLDSTSTLTGQETDDSMMMKRIRERIQQKEEFLLTNQPSGEIPLIQREFYSRPQKLQKPVWPPTELSPVKVPKPTHHNVQRVRTDIESERGLVSCASDKDCRFSDSGGVMSAAHFETGGVVSNSMLSANVLSGRNSSSVVAQRPTKDWNFVHMERIHEGSRESAYQNGSNSLPEQGCVDDKRLNNNLQVVSRRARQFETGRGDDGFLNDKTQFHCSELARLSSKRAVPNVAVRAREFETRSTDPSRDSTPFAGPALGRRHNRDSRSLESSGSNSSGETERDMKLKLSSTGNWMIPIGGKYLHCPLPAGYLPTEDIPSRVENSSCRMRARSNSAESWAAAMQGLDDKKHHKDSYYKGKVADQSPSIIPTTIEEAMANSEESLSRLSSLSSFLDHSSSSSLIPISVEQFQSAPLVSVTPVTTAVTRPVAIRPTQLDLSSPKRQVQHLELPRSGAEISARRSVSPAVSSEDRSKPLVIRRTKNTNIADEDRVNRRESYLKATGSDRMHVDSDFSDGDLSPQVVRSAHRRWRPPLFPGDIQQLRRLFEEAATSLGNSVSGGSGSSISLDREKCAPGSPADRRHCIREGPLHCKITDIDGKRATDRSWKQVWAVLRGPQLFLYKDRHQQSPIGSGDTTETALAKGIDMRASCVRVAEDYTKRKHVLRVSSAQPCRSEILLQADNPPDLADWVRVLQEQVSVKTDQEAKQECLTGSKQQAVPQSSVNAGVQSEGSARLSPQPPNKSKQPQLRNRSPTGQSPVSKTRKPSSQAPDGLTSPKSKTWRGRVAKQFRKIHQGATSPNSPTAPEGSTFGIPLELCPASLNCPYVPRLVEICTEIVETKGGLDVIGIYRVPGNNAAVTALTEEVNRSTEDITQQDVRWNDMNVVSSLLKSFLRKLPDSLFTTTLYPQFIDADKIDSPTTRMDSIRKLIKQLPPHHYCTLKHLMLHLKNVVENAEVNKMEARNLAIVFGPTLVRAVEDNMVTMVTDMSHQCKIVESLVAYAEWFFSEDDLESLNLPEPPAPTIDSFSVEMDAAANHSLLLGNISKVEGMKCEAVTKESKKEIFTSIISAAQRKVKRRTKTSTSSPEAKEEATTPNGIKEFPYLTSPINSADQKENSCTVDSPSKSPLIPTTIADAERQHRQQLQEVASSSASTKHHLQQQQQESDDIWFKYSQEENFKRRVEKFKQETEANLHRPRKLLDSASSNSSSLSDTLSPSYASGGGGGGGSTGRMGFPSNASSSSSSSVLLKTNSASSMVVTTRTSNLTAAAAGDRNSLNCSSSSVQYSASRSLMRRGSSAENICLSAVPTSQAIIKKKKYKKETIREMSQRTTSLDSLNKLPDSKNSGSEVTADEGSDLMAAMTSLFDHKIKTIHPSCSLSREDIPYADESPERPSTNETANRTEKVPASPQLYRNPSLHKSLFSTTKLSHQTAAAAKAAITAEKIKQEEKEKDDSVGATVVDADNVPDNERHLTDREMNLKRSESLSKQQDRPVSPLNSSSSSNSNNNNKLKRSESLNKTGGDKLKRSDSLTKNEKTESNISKRRELSGTGRRNPKELSTKLKRKNGMPERSIKRRHTVGGTKDLDKILDNKNKQDAMKEEESSKEKNLRTSSPDLSSTRRERLFFEVNLIGPENMVVALRQHLIGARPQSLPEPRVFKVPLESHV